MARLQIILLRVKSGRLRVSFIYLEPGGYVSFRKAASFKQIVFKNLDGRYPGDYFADTVSK